MALGYAVALRNTRVDAVRAAIDNGAGVSCVQFYSGTRPATAGNITTGNVLLGTLQFPVPCGVSAAGLLTFGVIASTTVALAGTPTWFRILDRNGGFVADGNVGVTGSDINFPSLTWTVGQVLQLSALAFTEGNP